MSAQVSVLPYASPRSPKIRIPGEATSILVELASDFAAAGSALYEIGHTVAELLPTLHERLSKRVEFVTLDQSDEAVRSARGSLVPGTRCARFMSAELDRGIVLRDASVAIMVGTSQQVPPLSRAQLLADVYRGLRAGGCALIMEVIRSHDSLLNNLFAAHTQASDRSDPHEAAEITQRAATLEEEMAIIQGSAFRSIDVFYRRYGLCGLIAIK